jgi:hypothetical protein
VTDTVLDEPSFQATAWFPAKMWTVNRFGDRARLVVVPAQFRGNQGGGLLRRFTELRFQVYYASQGVTDFVPPTVWRVESETVDNRTSLAVHAEDESGIERVVIAYTHDGSHWQTVDLDYAAVRDQWETEFTDLSGAFIYFVQVLDSAGNVTVTSNKGAYFAPDGSTIYLPVVQRNH